MSQSKKKIAVVGGGLVGALNACFLAKRGHHVDLYEMREDIRTQSVVKGRSINLALSCRGREALRAVGLEDYIVKSGIPMYGRMIHDLQGNRKPIYYGRQDQFIMSIDRRQLNELLLSAAEKYPNVHLHFNHKFDTCDIESGRITFKTAHDEKVEVISDLIIGCDGAYSAVRKQMMKSTRLNYEQEYIPHGYIELSIPAMGDGQFMMEKNYLHIWPRDTFMMIGLPNTEDNSFVITLFMPFAIFENIKTEDDLMTFFNKTFPDSVPLIGEEPLKKMFFSRKALPLISVKCTPYDVAGKCLIMGDAAHAMVPFYGQGMNCGFEDCLVFDAILDKCQEDFAKALPEYTLIRNPDAKAICDLAMYNYIEMRSSVNSRWFLMRKKVDNFLNWLMPSMWIPLYSSVSFTRVPYLKCIENRRWQDKILKIWLSSAGVAAAVSIIMAVWSSSRKTDSYIHNLLSLDKLLDMIQWKSD